MILEPQTAAVVLIHVEMVIQMAHFVVLFNRNVEEFVDQIVVMILSVDGHYVIKDAYVVVLNAQVKQDLLAIFAQVIVVLVFVFMEYLNIQEHVIINAAAPVLERYAVVNMVLMITVLE